MPSRCRLRLELLAQAARRRHARSASAARAAGAASASSSTSRPFFATARATPSSAPAGRGSLPSPPGSPGRRGKTCGVQAVIDQLDVRIRRERLQMVEVHPAAGRPASARRDLLALLPGRDGPDVLGVRRDADREVAQDRGVARDRGRACAGSARGAGRHPAGSSAASTSAWPKPAAAIGGQVAAQVARARRQQRARSRPPQHPPPGARSTRAAPGRDTPAGSAPARAICRCSACTGRSVGWRSETISKREAEPLQAPGSPGR